MTEIGKINVSHKIACPFCNEFLSDELLAMFIDYDIVPCPFCNQNIKLPDELVGKIRQSRHLGRNIDFTA